MKRLKVRQDVNGEPKVFYGDEEIPDVIAWQLSSSNIGTVATLVFKSDVVDIETKIDRVFGGQEVDALGAIPEDRLPVT